MAVCMVTAEVCSWGWGINVNCEGAGLLSTTSTPNIVLSLSILKVVDVFFQSLDTQLLSPGEGSG